MGIKNEAKPAQAGRQSSSVNGGLKKLPNTPLTRVLRLKNWEAVRLLIPAFWKCQRILIEVLDNPHQTQCKSIPKSNRTTG